MGHGHAYTPNIEDIIDWIYYNQPFNGIGWFYNQLFTRNQTKCGITAILHMYLFMHKFKYKCYFKIKYLSYFIYIVL